MKSRTNYKKKKKQLWIFFLFFGFMRKYPNFKNQRKIIMEKITQPENNQNTTNHITMSFFLTQSLIYFIRISPQGNAFYNIYIYTFAKMIM